MSYLLKKVLRPTIEGGGGGGDASWVEAYKGAYLAVMRGEGAKAGLAGPFLGYGPPTLVFTRGWGSKNAAFGKGGEMAPGAVLDQALRAAAGASVAPGGQAMERSGE